MDTYQIPFIMDIWWLALIFLVLATAGAWVFIYKWPLSPCSWKKSEYFLLTTLIIAIVSGAGENRQQIAAALYDLSTKRTEFSARQINKHLELLAVKSNIVCRTFTRSPLSPPEEELNKTQKKYDEQCAWFREALENLPKSPWAERQHLSLTDLGAPPPSGGDKWALESLMNNIDNYNSALSAQHKISQERKKSTLQTTLQYMNPILIVIALVIAFLKITADVRALSRKKKSA